MKNKYFLLLSIIVLVFSLFSCPNNTLTITFISCDETTGKYTTKQDIKVKSGKVFSDIDKPTINTFKIDRLIYKFDHWTETAPIDDNIIDETSEVFPDDAEIKGNKTLYASYTSKDVTYTVNFMAFNKDSSVYDNNVKSIPDISYNKKLSEIGKPTTLDDILIGGTKYSFYGWADIDSSSTILEEYNTAIVVDNTPITSNKTFCAIYKGDYLTFTAKANTVISFDIIGTLDNSISLQYRKDTDDEFKDYTWGTSTSATSGEGLKITLNTDENIYFKGNNATFSSSNSNYVNFKSTNTIEASENIMSLVNNYDTISHNYFFNSFFKDCSTLMTSPSLPAKTLAIYCYYRMFYGCTALTEAPELPAETLAIGCYVGMFQGCIALTEAPELPAQTLFDACYNSMFENCTALTEAPELPAETLASYCYYRMFYGCTNLSLINCYSTDISADECTNSWVYDVSSNGTFRCKSSTPWETGPSGIPTGWTIQNI